MSIVFPNRAGPRIALRRPAHADRREFLVQARRSRALHRPWLRAPSTPSQFRDYLAYMSRPQNSAFVVCVPPFGRIAGVINVTNIVLGAFRSGYLGYFAFAGFEGRGIMRSGLRAVIRQAFGEMQLHRLEANIQPGNRASLRLVKSCGFAREGHSPRYLHIKGQWRDHERWAILAD